MIEIKNLAIREKGIQHWDDAKIAVHIKGSDMNELQVFNHPEFGKIRTVEVNGEPWLVGKDVAVALGYAKPRNAIMTHVDDDDKTTALIQCTGSNYKSNAVLINESSLYSLVRK